MIEAKVFPNSQVTSTPFKIKSVFSLEESSLALKSMLGVSPVADQNQVESKRSVTATKSLPNNTNVSSTSIEDSGFCSFASAVEDTTEVPPSGSGRSEPQVSLFRSILQSRHNSLSEQQLLDRMNSRAENRGLAAWRGAGLPGAAGGDGGRPRAHSESEVLTGLYQSGLLERAHCSESGSPTLDQALTMPSCPAPYPASPDYDLAELARLLGWQQGGGGPVFPPSPPPAPPCRNPLSLFGWEDLQRGRGGEGAGRPSLSGPLTHRPTSCSTPPQYYQASFLFGGSPNLAGRAPRGGSPGLERAGQECTWSGQLPSRHHPSPTFSCKIFLGGVPWDVTELTLIQSFSQFGTIRIEWPGKETSPSPPKGYVYIVFEREQQVPLLLSQCTHDPSNGGSWYFQISSRRMRSKEVQIIPWLLADSNFVKTPCQRLDPQKTVFVGALHGMLNAEGLATIFDDLFGGVVYAGIDTDKHKYPIGSGRVTFNNIRSYMKAVAAAFVDLKCPQFSKKVQVDPYLEDALCSVCLLKQGPYFCRDLCCFQYFCRHCWEAGHGPDKEQHQPLMRNTRSGGGPAISRPIITLTPPPTRPGRAIHNTD